jgi:hypothetical protein
MLFFLLAAQVYAVHLRSAERGAAQPVVIDRTIYHAKDEKVLELGTELQCIINLAVQYAFVYTALALVSTYADLRLGNRSGVVLGLRSALMQSAVTVNSAPMLGLLLLVIDMRFAGMKYPPYTSWWMFAATYALGLQTLMVLCLPVVTGEIVECEDDGSLKSPTAPMGFFAKCVYGVRCATQLVLYGGIIGCMYVLFGPHHTTATPAAVHCIALLCGLYYCVSCALVFVRDFASASRSAAALAVTYSVVSLSPMLGVLFAAARVRAWQVRRGDPQPWAQVCMYSSTYAVLAQALLVLVCAIFGGDPVKSRGDGDFGVQNMRPSLYYPIAAGRYLALLVTYGCVVAVVVSIFVIDAGPIVVSPPVSPAVLNTIVLASAFFTVYLALFVTNTARDVLFHRLAEAQPAAIGRLDARMHHPQREAVWIKWIKTAENARLTVQFCPMFAVLFLAVRWRALQVTDGMGGPQRWCQHAMLICTVSVLVQLLMVVGVAVVQDRIPETSKTGVVLTQPTRAWLRIPMIAARYLAFLGLYGGLIAVLSSVFLIRPETASPVE